MNRNNSGILLESGTNELELLEFNIGNEYYGINVMKVREVLTKQKLTNLPQAPEYVEGMIKVRNEIISQISLVRYLGQEEADTDKIILTEFNKLKIAFRVTDVSKIERISWEDIEKMDKVNQDSNVIGVVKYQDKLVMVLDFEKIVSTIIGLQEDYESVGIEALLGARLAIADDSNFVLTLVKESLSEGGYENIKSFSDGRQAWDFISNNPEAIDVLITDIEMPQMDGLTLCKKVKDNPTTRHIMVMLYSSLISDDIRHKGDSVGADFQVNKPEFKDILKKLSAMNKEKAS